VTPLFVAVVRPTTLEPGVQRMIIPVIDTLKPAEGTLAPSAVSQSVPGRKDVAERLTANINSLDALTSPGMEDSACWMGMAHFNNLVA